MNLTGINLQLLLGAAIPSPSPERITRWLDSVEVTRTDNGPATFQLVFRVDRAPGSTTDFELVDEPLLSPSTRVILIVTINGAPTTLMDGFITHQELAHSREFGAPTFTVTGEDLSVAMDLIELSIEYPGMPDAAIAALTLAKYAAIGVMPVVIPPPVNLPPTPEEQIPQQNLETDRALVQRLAGNYGFIFHVSPGPVVMTNVAYWGPPIRLGTPQRALTVEMGPATNVEKMNFQFDYLSTKLVDGMVQDIDTDIDGPVTTFASTRLPPLAMRPALGLTHLFQRRTMFQQSFDLATSLMRAQAITDVSTDRVVVAKGELDTFRYGAVIDSPGLIAVRGAGESYDGIYYVQSVNHSLAAGKYRQEFTLTREGVGSTVSRVTP